jgi:hypothetical protein
MLVYKVVNNVLPSKIDPYHSGDDTSLSTYGKGSYFSTDQEYVKNYIQPWKAFGLEIEFSVEGSTCYLSEESVIRDDENQITDIMVNKTIITAERLADKLAEFDLIELDLDDKNIVLIPENKTPKIQINSLKVHSENAELMKELKRNKLNKIVFASQFQALEEILSKYS